MMHVRYDDWMLRMIAVLDAAYDAVWYDRWMLRMMLCVYDDSMLRMIAL